MHPDFYDWVLEIFRLLHSVLVTKLIKLVQSINQSIIGADYTKSDQPLTLKTGEKVKVLYKSIYGRLGD